MLTKLCQSPPWVVLLRFGKGLPKTLYNLLGDAVAVPQEDADHPHPHLSRSVQLDVAVLKPEMG